MKLSVAYSRIAVRPFPSSPWVYEILKEIKSNLYRIFLRIKAMYSELPEYNKITRGIIGYGSIPFLSVLRFEDPIWEGKIPSGRAKGMKLRIYLDADPRLSGVDGGILPTSKNALESRLHFEAPRNVTEIDDFLYVIGGVEPILEAIHHELIHAEDPKSLERWNKSRKEPNSETYIKPHQGRDQYFRQPIEVSAYEGSSYSYFKNAHESNIPMKQAIQRYIKKDSHTAYVNSIRADPKRWRQFLERVYKSADQAYRET